MTSVGRLIRRLFGRLQLSQTVARKTESVLPPFNTAVTDSIPSALPMPQSSQTPSSPLSAGELRFLREFLPGVEAAEFDQRKDFWAPLIGAEPRSAIQRFERAGLIARSDLSTTIMAVYTSKELSQICKKRGLQVSGTKAEKVSRLVKGDDGTLQELVSHREFYSCTDEGRRLVEEDIAREKSKHAEFEEAVESALQTHQFAGAAQLVATYEARQPIQRRTHNVSEDEEVLKLIFTAKPSMLAGLTDQQLDALRLPAALGYLLGLTDDEIGQRIISDQQSCSSFNPGIACRALELYARGQFQLAQQKRVGKTPPTASARVGIDWDHPEANEKAVAWAREHGGVAVGETSDTGRKAIQEAVSIYLNTPGMKQQDLVNMLEPMFGKARAETIATTEVTKAYAEATNEQQRELARHGLKMRRIWNTAGDDLVCPICRSLDRKPESEWADKLPDGPPAHVGCRCSLGLDFDVEDGKNA